MINKLIFKPSNRIIYQVYSYKRGKTYLCLYNFCNCEAFEMEIKNKNVPIVFILNLV